MLSLGLAMPATAQERHLVIGRATVVFFPRDGRLAANLAHEAAEDDSFPGIPRPKQSVYIEVAPDHATFRRLVGPFAPEWGAAVAFPGAHRIVMQGSQAGSDAGDPIETLRHELAHLALHEALGDLPPRWFDEGYAGLAAHEWRREDELAANLGLAWRGMPTLDELEKEFDGGTTAAQEAYALAYRAVADLSELGGPDGLAPLFANWKRTRSLDAAVRASYGITLTEFEARWRSRTRRRYGALALMGDFVLGGALMGFILIPLYLARRRRDRERLRAMIADDRVNEALAASDPIAELLDLPAADDTSDSGPAEPP